MLPPGPQTEGETLLAAGNHRFVPLQLACELGYISERMGGLRTETGDGGGADAWLEIMRADDDACVEM